MALLATVLTTVGKAAPSRRSVAAGLVKCVAIGVAYRAICVGITVRGAQLLGLLGFLWVDRGVRGRGQGRPEPGGANP